MGTYNEPQYVVVCKRVSAREMYQDWEILKVSANKREKVAGILSSIQPIKQK